MSTSDQKGWRDPRPIVERIIIKGNLILQTAAHFGSGDVEPFSHIDMLLLRDSLENKPLLPGASIAGALRNYLRERLEGYRAAEKADSVVTRLFGVSKGRTGGVQSALIVNDALSAGGTARIELRDGVKIDPQTRTAEEGAKFDLEVLAAGTVFPLHFELALEADEQNELKRALALTLQGLQNGDIHLGARKQRGYGRVNVTNWQVWAYNLQQRGDLLAWLAAERPDLTPQPAPKKGADIVQLLLADTGEAGLEDKRHYFRIQGTFALNGSLLIRAGFGLDPNGP
ncbi:MAG: RAMP superfamily CRISPR-associated protein, partial [Anaerolineae bacterium]